MNEPMPPTPITTHASARRDTAAADRVEGDRERLRHRGGIVRRSRPGRGSRSPPARRRSSARPPFACNPSVRYSAHRFVRPARHHSHSDRTRCPHPTRRGRRRARSETPSPTRDSRGRRTRGRGSPPGAAEQRAVRPLRRVRAADRRRGAPPARLRPDAGSEGSGTRLDPDVVRPVVDGRPHALSARSEP